MRLSSVQKSLLLKDVCCHIRFDEEMPVIKAAKLSLHTTLSGESLQQVSPARPFNVCNAENMLSIILNLFWHISTFTWESQNWQSPTDKHRDQSCRRCSVRQTAGEAEGWCCGPPTLRASSNTCSWFLSLKARPAEWVQHWHLMDSAHTWQYNHMVSLKVKKKASSLP